MTPGIKVESKAAIDAFRLYSKKLGGLVGKAIKESALIVERDAKSSFKRRGDPSVYNEPPRSDTGRLRASITHRTGEADGEMYAEVGTNVEYGPDVEYGTSRTMPHPFMSYALGMNQHDVNEKIADAIRAAENA
jgi:phage gpG-like protein